MYNHLLYFAYWFANALILFVFASLFPGDVVLGNWRFSAVEAAIYSGFWVTFFVWIMWDFAMARKLKFDVGAVTLGYFWLVNTFAFWVVARFPAYSGLGITSYFWAFAIGLGAYLVQRIAWKWIVK
jgi:hypothetical protein